MTRLRILILDDHPIFRLGLKELFSSEPDFLVVGETTGGGDAVRMAYKVRPNVILLDNRMPGSSTANLLTEFNRAKCGARTVLMVDELRQSEIIEALQLGARGVLGKDSPPELFLKCVRAVIGGQFWIGQESVVRLVEILKDPSLAPKECFGLTPRELQITEAIVDGLTNRDIALQFSLSQQTVKNHINKIFDKVGVSSRLELAMFVVHHDILNGSYALSRLVNGPYAFSRLRAS